MERTENVILGVIASLIAAALIALASSEKLRSLGLRFISATTRHLKGSSSENADSEFVRRHLVAKLRQDQSTRGIHRGQFGRNTDPDNEKRFVTGAEDVRTKPRIYLTAWPTLILSARGLLPTQTSLAIEGVDSLFKDDRIRIYQGAPLQAAPHLESSLVSYRHTIAGALLLYQLTGWGRRVAAIANVMLDDKNGWQNADGGWAQCDREHTDSDIWCSAYAIRFCARLVEDARLSGSEAVKVQDNIKKTITFFKKRWREDRWAVGTSSSEENSVLILIELGSALQSYDIDFLSEVVATIKAWLGPVGRLSESYITKCSGNSPSALHARMAYALYRAGQPLSSWLEILSAAIQNLDEKFNSSDMAFVVDLTYQMSGNNRSVDYG